MDNHSHDDNHFLLQKEVKSPKVVSSSTDFTFCKTILEAKFGGLILSH